MEDFFLKNSKEMSNENITMRLNHEPLGRSAACRCAPGRGWELSGLS